MIPLPFSVKGETDYRGGNLGLLAKNLMNLLDNFYFSGKYSKGSMTVKRHIKYEDADED